MRGLTFLLLASASISFGQLDSNSVTIQASRGIDLKPDVATLGVSVASGLSTGLDEVVAALHGTGITSANLVGVGTIARIPLRGSTSETSLSWSFSLSVPFAALKNTVATLSALQGNLARQSGGLTLEFSVDGSDVSPQLRSAQTCPIPDLIADARSEAKKLTDAAGMGLGPILALADSQAAASHWFNTPSFGVLSFYANGSGYAGFLLSQPVSTPVYCSLTVKFALLRN